MKNINLNRTAYMFVIWALVFSLIMQANVSFAEVEADVDTECVLSFLRDVVQLDMTRYETRLSTVATNSWPWLGGIAETTGQYVLDSTGWGGKSILTVSFALWGNQLKSCSLYEDSQGPLILASEPSKDLVINVETFLQKYQVFSEDSKLADMISIFNSVEADINNSKIVDNLKFDVYIEDERVLFTWSNTLNGVAYSRLLLKFEDGTFSHFGDDRSLYSLGSSEVNTSQEEAVNIALESVKSYSYRSGDKEVTNFGVVNEHIHSSLSFINKTDRLELYPCWIVDLPLDAIYPGSVAFIKVIIWADKGEVVSCEALGYGFPSEYLDSSPTPETTPETTSNHTLPSPSIQNKMGSAYRFPIELLVVGLVALIITTFTALIVIKKRRNNPSSQ